MMSTFALHLYNSHWGINKYLFFLTGKPNPDIHTLYIANILLSFQYNVFFYSTCLYGTFNSTIFYINLNVHFPEQMQKEIAREKQKKTLSHRIGS